MKGELIQMIREVIISDGNSSHKINLIFPKMCCICHNEDFELEFLTGVFIKGDHKNLESVFQCTNTECNRLLIGYYTRVNVYIPFELVKLEPNHIPDKNFSPEIKEISPRFIKLFNQLIKAEQKNLALIFGIGYRKALEFLIKDYLVYLDPKRKDKFINESLKYCLYKLDNNIPDISKKITWLRSDVDVYYREWNGKDVNDLKKMIEIISSFITANIRMKKHIDNLNK